MPLRMSYDDAFKLKSKFRVGQVVMVVKASVDGGSRYPVKLDHRAFISPYYTSVAWMDSLGNAEYEHEMRSLTARERGADKGGKNVTQQS